MKLQTSKLTSQFLPTRFLSKWIAFLLISRVIQGQFPDYKQVIPSLNTFEVKRDEFLAAARRASIIASASNNVVRFSFG